MTSWLAVLQDCEKRGEAAMLVTVAATDGSAPRDAGTKMVVTASGSHGTIGGGSLEFQAIAVARQMLRDGAGPVLRRYPLGPSLGQCCGGHVTLLFEPRQPEQFNIALFGAGHVGRAVVQVLGSVSCRIRWIDPRPDAFPDFVPPGVTIEVTATPERLVDQLAPDSWVLIMTHSHALDLGLAARALQAARFPYIGLIGSTTKRARFEKRLRELGLPDASLATLVCPIGLPDIRGKHPGEIAIATAADILRRREAMLNHLPLAAPAEI